jgi:hypothetical protein
MPRFARASRVRMLTGLFAVTLLLGATMDIGMLVAQAAAGQYLKLVTSDGGSTFYVGRCFRTDFKVQTDNLDANSVDVIVPYSPAYVQPYTGSGCTVAATAIVTDGLFPSYPSNSISGNRIQVTGYDPSGTSPVNTGSAPADRVLGHVYWKVMSASGSFHMNYEYVQGSTTDTNMAQNNGNGSDVLDGVDNLSLTLAADATAPTFTSLSPASGASNVSVTSGLSYVFSDAGAGVNSGSLVTKLNGTSQTVVKSGCTTTNSNRHPSCNASVSPGTLSYATVYTVVASGSDLASTPNRGTQSWSFTTEDDTDAPYVTTQVPSANQTGVAVGTTVAMHIKDYKGNLGVTPGLGVDLSTVRVTIQVGAGAPTTYQSGDPQFSATGTSADRSIVITPSSPFPQNTVITVTVAASDLHSAPNVMTPVTYTFTTTDSTAPVLSAYTPAQGASGVAADTNVSVTITDGGAGVDIANTTVTLNGTSYGVGNAAFSYTGTAASYTVTVNPASNFSGGQTVAVVISTRDLATTPNSASTSYSFSIASSCSTCSVSNESPSRFSTSAALSSVISFHVKDTGAGIDPNTIRAVLIGSGPGFPVSPLTLTGASTQMAITGSAADKTVTITLAGALESNVPAAITIDASDINGLDMSTVAYTFMHLDTVIGSGSTVSSCSSAAVASCSCPSVPADTGNGGQGGGGRRPVPVYTSSVSNADVMTIIRLRRIPGSGGILRETLTPEEAKAVHQCYVDDTSLHGAAASFTDVPAGAWYKAALDEFVQAGIIDAAQEFRPADGTLRSEIAKMLTKLPLKPKPFTPPASPSFDDVRQTLWYYAPMEQAGANGWIHGYGNCYGTHPCIGKPAEQITRAEEAAMIVRFLGLQRIGAVAPFPDVPADAWYADVVQTAADFGIMKGEDGTRIAAPDRTVTRAESVLMLSRARALLVQGSLQQSASSAKTGGTSGSAYGASLLGSVGGPAGASAGVFLTVAAGIVPFWIRSRRR